MATVALTRMVLTRPQNMPKIEHPITNPKDIFSYMRTVVMNLLFIKYKEDFTCFIYEFF